MEAVKLKVMYSANNENQAKIIELHDEEVGYVSLHRKVRSHWIWQDPIKFQWWVDILMECNHEDKKVQFGFELIDCKRGQSVNSLLTWSKRWRVDISTVRRFLQMLVKDGMVNLENVKKTTRLTVCKYDSYQQNRHATQSTSKGDAKATQFGSNTNNNEINNDNKVMGDVPPPPKPQKKAFVPPTKDQVKAFIESLTGNHHNSGEVAQNFMNHYQSNGWKVGKNKMQDWEATVRNCMKWEKNEKLLSERKTPIANNNGIPSYMKNLNG